MVDTYIADNTDVFLSEILIATAIAGLIISIILMISYYKIFKKNQVKGWKAIIPIYNVYTLMKIAEINPLSIFLLLVPIVNLFVMALVSVKLANKYNKGALFAIGLLFLPFIFILYFYPFIFYLIIYYPFFFQPFRPYFAACISPSHTVKSREWGRSRHIQ